jgi:hypothetical protein
MNIIPSGKATLVRTSARTDFLGESIVELLNVHFYSSYDKGTHTGGVKLKTIRVRLAGRDPLIPVLNLDFLLGGCRPFLRM